MNMSTQELVEMFNQINVDCAESGCGLIVPLSDVEFYTWQIIEIFNVRYDEAIDAAQSMADFKQ